MTFETVVFGSYEVGVGFTPGSSISAGGFRVFIVPTVNMGDYAMDVSISYVDQFGNSATTTVSTSVSAHTVAGSHIQMVLNNGDSGVRQVTAVTVVGGTAGETFNLESWNEGLGSSIEMGTRCQMDSHETAEWTTKDYARSSLLEEETSNSLQYTQNVNTSNVDYDRDKFTLQVEQIDIYPQNSVHVDTDDGFLPGMFTLDNATMSMKLDLVTESDYYKIDANYQRKGFEIIASGFTKITFDYNVVLDSSHFIAELVDSSGTVKWSKNGTASGTGQIVTFVDDYCLFRVRCTAPDSPSIWTSPAAPWDNHMYISNVKLDRYKTSGYIEQTTYKYRENMKQLEELFIGGTLGTTGTNIQAQIDIGDSLATTTGWIGPGGTSATKYSLGGNVINTAGRNGSYWRTKIFLTGDGRYTPSFDYLKYQFLLYLYERLLEWVPVAPKALDATIDGRQLPLSIYGNIEKISNVGQVLSGNSFVTPANLLILATQQHQYSVDNDIDVVDTTRATGMWYYQFYDANDFVYGCNYSNVEYVSNTFKLKAQTIEPNYGTEINSDPGFLACSPVIDAGNKELSITLPADTTFNVIDTEYERHSFIWQVSGFTSLEFDYDVSINSSYFILELVGADGTVKWSKNGTSSGTGQVVSMTTTKWEFRLRCKANYTSPAIFSDYIKVSNIKITRYPLTGYIEQPWRMGKEHVDILEQLDLKWTPGTAGTAVKVQMNIDDTWGGTGTGWIGPDGTSGSYYTGDIQAINDGGYSGNYYKFKIYFESDGRYTPTFTSITVMEFIANYLRLLAMGKSWSESTVGIVMSGYVRDQEDAIIQNGVKVVLESTYVFGKDTMGAVNPNTGFFQIFVKDAKYDKRHLILQVSGKTTNLSLAEYGNPAILDATTGEVPNQDLHFWKAPLCKSVAHVDSLVTY